MRATAEEGKRRGLFERSEFRSPRTRRRRPSEKPDNRGGASWFVLLVVEKNEQKHASQHCKDRPLIKSKKHIAKQNRIYQAARMTLPRSFFALLRRMNKKPYREANRFYRATRTTAEEGKRRGLFEQSEFRSPRTRRRRPSEKPDNRGGAFPVRSSRC